jgi:hypothetical protein
MVRTRVTIIGGTLLGLVAFCFVFGRGKDANDGHEEVEKLPHLHRKTKSEVISELGRPDQSLTFTLANSPGGEFRCELHNFYPFNRPEGVHLPIKELWWKHPEYTVVVWFQKVASEWVAFDSCRWKKGIEF